MIGQVKEWMALEQFNERLKEQGLELWEFGASQTVMPVPDFTVGTYRTSSVMFITKRLPDKKAKVLGIELWGNTAFHDLLSPDFMERVKENFEKFGIIISEGDLLPTSDLWMKVSTSGGIIHGG